MSMRMSVDDQLKFLLTCVKWSVNGKVDFTEVANECGVVTKGAAAKRYERMLKQHGIHPSGGPLDSPTSPVKKNVSTVKASKKRKHDESTTTIKHCTDVNTKPDWTKRTRTENQPEVKQEPLPMGYPPFLFHPMIPPPGSYMPRPLPTYIHQGLQHPLPFPSHIPPPYHMMMGMQNNQHCISMPQSMQPAMEQPNQSVPVPECTTLMPFDNLGDRDFVGGGFESMLYEEPIDSAHQNHNLQHNDAAFDAPQDLQEASTQSEVGQVTVVKKEVSQILNAPICDFGTPHEAVTFSEPAQESSSTVAAALPQVDCDLSLAIGTTHETATSSTEAVTVPPVKVEGASCIFIQD